MENKRKHQFRNVLIVEDDLGQQPLWQHILSRSSDEANVTWAVSAEQALTILKESAFNGLIFDLIVVDLFLAGSETGLSFLNCDEVKHSKAQTILVSAANKDYLADYIHDQLRNTKVIAKPLNVVKCEKVLDDLIAKRQLYEPENS